MKPITILMGSLCLSGCGSGSGAGSGDGDSLSDNAVFNASAGSSVIADDVVTVANNSAEVVFSEQPALSSGNVSMVGTIAVSDEAGDVSDIVGSFFALRDPVSGDDLSQRFIGLSSFCEVEPDVVSGFNDVSVSFIAEIPGTDRTISAGESVVLSEVTGTYVTLSEQGVGELVFYGTDSSTSIPTGPVPEPLEAFVTGSEFPAFTGFDFPVTNPLTGFDSGSTGEVRIDTEFRWDTMAEDGAASGSFIRILSSERGGFFIDDSLKVTCLVRDDGSFSFPAEIRRALGDGYTGGTPIVSRVAVSTVIQGNAALFLVRESFAE